MKLAEFVEARIAETELWAVEASRDGDRFSPTGHHWQWVCSECDTPADVARCAGEESGMLSCQVDDEHYDFDLRSVEQYPLDWGKHTLPAWALHSVSDEISAAVAGHIAGYDPARVLRECETYRAVLALGTIENPPLTEDDYFLAGYERACEQVTGALAGIWREHPDYRPEWGRHSR